MTKFCLTLVLLALPAIVQAQTHPCDQPEVTSGRQLENTPLTLSTCVLQADAVQALVLYRNGTPQNLTAVSSCSAGPNAQGKVCIQSIVGTFARGSYTLEVAAVNMSVAVDGKPATSQVGAKSAPFDLQVVGAISPPAAPSRPRVSG